MGNRDLDRLRILVAERSSTLRHSVSGVLWTLGIRALARARDSAEALSLVRVFRPDLVVAGMDLAPRGGLEFVRTLRGEYDLPVVMLAPAADETRIRRASDAGVDALLALPVGVESLYLAIVGVLENTRQAAEEADADREPGAEPLRLPD